MSKIVSYLRLPKDDLDFVSLKVDLLANLNEFKNESILLTGGTGFFGKWLSQSLAILNDNFSLGNRMTIVTRDAQRAIVEQPWLASRSDFSFVESDVRQFQNSESFTTIIHGAASASQSLNDLKPDEMYSVITQGSQRVLDIAEASKTKRVHFISSGAVYGDQPAHLDQLRETDVEIAANSDSHGAYGRAKRAAEKLFITGSGKMGFDLSISRCFAFVGPHLPLDSHFAIGNFIRCALDGKPIHILGDGSPLRSYLYAADLAIWLLVQIVNSRQLSICNVGSGSAVSIAKLAEVVHAVACDLFPDRKTLECPVQIALKSEGGKLPKRYVPAVARAQKEFQLQVWTGLEESIRKTILWHLRTIASAEELS